MHVCSWRQHSGIRMQSWRFTSSTDYLVQVRFYQIYFLYSKRILDPAGHCVLKLIFWGHFKPPLNAAIYLDRVWSHFYRVLVVLKYHRMMSHYLWHRFTQSPLIRLTAKWPALEVLKYSSNLDAHRFLILQAWALAVS